MRSFIISLFIILGFTHGQAPLNTVATVGMIGDMLETIGGDCLSVTTLMGPGIDPHLYRASAGDVRTLNNAEAIFYGGLRLEGQLVEVLERLGARRPTMAVMEALPAEERLMSEEYVGQYDPHLWMDAGRWARLIPAVVSELSTLRPDCREGFETNGARYEAELLALDAWMLESVASIPEAQRVLVTAHDAFGYFADAYGLRVVSIQGISTETEASLADIREVAEGIVAEGIPAIFVETSVNPRNIQAVQAAAGARGHAVIIGGELYSDALGERGTPEGSYIGMMRHNTRSIVEALGGETAAWPEALSDWAARWGL